MSMLGRFPTETLILHKNDGQAVELVCLVSEGMICCEDVNAGVEEGDFYERELPNNTREYYRVIDRGFFKGNQRIPDYYQSKVVKVSKNEVEGTLRPQEDNIKENKLFISHSSKDKAYMVALAEMLEDIGMPDGSFVCTSVPGHGIPGGAKIYDWLREQFLTCHLRVLFALSHNYYTSAASLNEMGAAWVTKATDTLLFLPGFHSHDIQGCIDPREMGISFEAEDEELKHRLNEFKDTLINEHNLPAITQARWERHRNKFITAVRTISATRREDVSDEMNAPTLTVEQDNIGRIPVEAAFLLVYAASGNGQILRIQDLGNPTQVSADGKQFMADLSKRESARWQEALEMLISWGWVKPVGRRGGVFEVTGTGYKKAGWLKDGMQINTDNEPLDEIKEFE